MKTTLNKIRAHRPCADGWENLLRHLGKLQADAEPVSILTILNSNGLDDAVWCLRAVNGHDREIRLFAVWCARQVQHSMADQHIINAIDVAERHANGLATNEELHAAREAALEDLPTARNEFVRAITQEVASISAWHTAWLSARTVCRRWAATWETEWDTARRAQESELRRICELIEQENKQ